MVEQSDSLVVEILRRIQGDVADIKADLRAIEGQVDSIEATSFRIGLRLDHLLDRMDQRDDTMACLRRLELSDLTH